MKFCYVMTEEDSAPMTSIAMLHEGIGAFGDVFGEIGANYKDIETKGFYAERRHMEERDEFKQIIPCFIIRDHETKRTLFYQRKPTHTEGRLAGLYTPLFGGHIDPGDAPELEDSVDYNQREMADGFRLPEVLHKALRREMHEETGIELDINELFFEGFLYDPSNDVGRVHLGVIFTYYTHITEELVEQITNLPEIHKVIVVNNNVIDELHDDPDIELESWAQIMINYYVAMAEEAEPCE